MSRIARWRCPDTRRSFSTPDTRTLYPRDGGAGGIRTLDRPLQAYNGLANRRLQPLGHVSSKADMPDAAASRKRQMWRTAGPGNAFFRARPERATLGGNRTGPVMHPSWPSAGTARIHFVPENSGLLPVPRRTGTANDARGRRGWCVYIECRIQTARRVAVPYNGVDGARAHVSL